MKIRLNSLKEGQQIIQKSLPKEHLNISENCFKNPINLTLSLDKGTTEIYITGKVETEGNFQCDRCLSPFSKHLEATFKVILSSTISEITSDENIIPISHSTYEVDLSPQIRDTLLLSIPTKKLCDKKCRGICPSCGVNLNFEECLCSTSTTSTGWKPLEKLYKKFLEEN